MSDEVAIMHNVRPYASDGATGFVEAREMMAPGCVGTEEATISFVTFEVSGSMEGSPNTGEGERSCRKHMKDLRSELGPGSPIDYA